MEVTDVFYIFKMSFEGDSEEPSNDICFLGPESPEYIAVKDELFCGDCWRSKPTNTFCKVFFYFNLVLAVALIAQIIYFLLLAQDKKIDKRQTIHVYKVFVLMLCLLITRILYYTDGFYNYEYIALSILRYLT